MANVGASLRIRGTKEALTKAGNIRRAPLAAMRQAAIERSNQSVSRFRSEMNAEYTSAWATGQIARSVRAKVKNETDGVSIQFTAHSGLRNHLSYITGILPDSVWRKFPRGPFTIDTDPRLMHIRNPGHARRFIQDPGTGRMMGSRPGRILKKKVLWGSASGGFSRDVIAEVSQSEGESFVADMMAAVTAALSQSTK